MSLNCKVGDIAVIVRSDSSPEHIGRLVDVLRPGSEPGYWRVRIIGSPLRVVDEHWRPLPPTTVFNAADRVLRPIRWDDREDPRDLRVSKPADTAPAMPDYMTGQGA